MLLLDVVRKVFSRLHQHWSIQRNGKRITYVWQNATSTEYFIPRKHTRKLLAPDGSKLRLRFYTKFLLPRHTWQTVPPKFIDTWNPPNLDYGREKVTFT